MRHKKGSLFLLFGFAIASVFIALGTAHGRPKNDPQDDPALVLTKVAVADMGRLYDGSSAPKEYERNESEVAQDADKRMKMLGGIEYLEPAEIQEFLTLVGKFTPTPQEAERITALQTLSGSRGAEMRAIQTKESASLTAQDKKRLQTLVDASRNFRNVYLPNIEAQIRNSAIARAQTFRVQQMAELRAAVSRYAKEKGIQHVFDSGTLIYSQNDITDKVLEKVKKK